MAMKELFIVFVYDTQKCQKEEDDPQDAVLYFHPSWVSDQQRLALCGQLMGTSQFLISSFGCPQVLSLDSGKFVIKQSGRFVITVGTDHNIPDWMLMQRANVLLGLVQFFHLDLENVSCLLSSDGSAFKEKLAQIFETFIPIVQFSANIFSNIPLVRLPKSASTIFLEAMQILHCCQEKKNVLGGVVLYQNKVVATQLNPSVTKQLIFSDPYRIKSPAECVSVPFHLPVGVQLLYVYVCSKEYSHLLQESSMKKNSIESVSVRKLNQKKVMVGKMPTAKEQLSSLKRDTSRIFTVPEEKEGEIEQCSDNKFSNGEPDNFAFTKPRFHERRQSSDCGTPLKDINMILHDKTVLICHQASEMNGNSSNIPINNGKKQNANLRNLRKSKLKDRAFHHKNAKRCLINYSESEIQSLSLTDLSSSKVSKNVPMRCYSFGLPKITREMCSQDSDDYNPFEKLPPGKHFYNTIADPVYPLFRSDGFCISNSLFNEYLSQHYHSLNAEKSLDSSREGTKTESPVEPKTDENLIEQSISTCDTDQHVEQDDTVSPSSKQELYRRSLSLPLKSFNLNDNSCDSSRKRSTSYTEGERESPFIDRNTLGSLQLTPLMSKLSLLALEDKTSGFCSKETTPSEMKDCSLPSEEISSGPTVRWEKIERKSLNRERLKEDNGNSNTLEKAILYVFGQQNMELMLLIEGSSVLEPEVVHSLWEICLNGLNPLEKHLKHCLERFPQPDGLESYGYMYLDPNWDMMHRGGPWGTQEMEALATIHDDFKKTSNLTEIIVRCEESTVYGYQCGKTEVFYQQNAGSTFGLPTPSDLMGMVPLKARRRLERDHGILLL